ncbi:MAG TPA: NADH-ubiquinone oxidoreductase-F iron-sulfur binding region domain-containing protein [Vicinamibacteria bacterium]|nr:NADH-ubiquinone oxidoreductase-F iron-sulfur binding region domain-containing protein [Vicinamibacteria bacterium]
MTAFLDGPDLMRRLADSGLRGRGGGWFPAAVKWRAVRTESLDPFTGAGRRPVVVANGAEGEPGSIKDRHVMNTRAAEVLAGLRLACRAVGASEAYVYLKGSFAGPAQALDRALQAGAADGLRIEIRRGEDTYIAGEETALLESLEGRRAWPRPKPPLPFAAGLFGRPTLVQNVETLARVPAAVEDPAGFRASETTFVSLWGHVRRPGVYEVRLGTPLARIMEHEGGGATDGIGMLFPGGPSAAPLDAGAAAAPLDPDALRALGSGLGTAALLVVGRAACPVSVAASLAAFFERESCGQCPPCAMGSARLSEILRRLEAGEARAADLGYLSEAAGFMSDHGYCAHPRSAASAVQGLLSRFNLDVDAHVAARRCPRPEGRCDPFAAGSPERAAIEALA